MRDHSSSHCTNANIQMNTINLGDTKKHIYWSPLWKIHVEQLWRLRILLLLRESHDAESLRDDFV